MFSFLKPKHTFQSVAKELVAGLEDGSISLGPSSGTDEESVLRQCRKVAHLEPVAWKVFWKMTVEELPIEQVAEQLGMTVHAVQLAKSQVLRRLREESANLTSD